MKSNPIPTALALLSCLLAPFAAAQSGAEISTRVDLVAWGESVSGLSLGSSTGAPSTALAFRYSKSLPYSGALVMEIHQASGNAAPSAAPATGVQESLPPELVKRRKDHPTLVALAKLPANSKHVTVLLAPAAAGTFNTFVIDDDPSHLPAGKLRVFNLAGNEISMRFNSETQTRLKTNQSFLVAPKDGQIVYELAYEKDGEWNMQENNLTRVADNEQAQMIVLQSDASFFVSSSGSKSGFLQTVILRRSDKEGPVMTELTASEKAALDKEARRNADADAEKARPKGPKSAPKSR